MILDHALTCDNADSTEAPLRGIPLQLRTGSGRELSEWRAARGLPNVRDEMNEPERRHERYRATSTR
jgi:hypothetical protein